MVKRIEGTCTLIPVVYGLGDNDVPLTLRGIRWVRVELDQTGFKELADAILGLSSKPLLASLSAKTGDRSLQQLGLSENATRLALLLSERSETGLSLDPLLGAAEVRTVLNLAEDQVAMAADELEEGGLVKLHHAVGEGNIGFFRISPTARFFIKTDPAIKGWHPNQDARALAAAILNKSNEGLAMAEADRLLGWGPRRINPAAQYLDENSQANCLGSNGSHPYAFSHILVTPKTKRFTFG
jgi:hypothetical protein